MKAFTGFFAGCELLGVSTNTPSRPVSSEGFKPDQGSDVERLIVLYIAPELHIGLALRGGLDPSEAVSQWVSDAEAAMALLGAGEIVHLIDAQRYAVGAIEADLILTASGVELEVEVADSASASDLFLWTAAGEAFLAGEPKTAALSRALDAAADLPSARMRGDRSAITAAANALRASSGSGSPIVDVLTAYAERIASFAADIELGVGAEGLGGAERDAVEKLQNAVDARAVEAAGRIEEERGGHHRSFEEARILRLQLSAIGAQLADHEFAVRRCASLLEEWVGAVAAGAPEATPLRSEWPPRMTLIAEVIDRLGVSLKEQALHEAEAASLIRAEVHRKCGEIRRFETLLESIHRENEKRAKARQHAVDLLENMVATFAVTGVLVAPERSEWPDGHEATFGQLERLAEMEGIMRRSTHAGWSGRSGASAAEAVRVRALSASTPSAAAPPDEGAAATPLLKKLSRPEAFRKAVMRRLRKKRFGREVEEIRSCQLFDEAWYLEAYPDVREARQDASTHFLLSGWRELRAPGPHFCVVSYLKDHPDVARSGQNPLLHFIRHGEQERRKVRPVSLGPGARR